MKNNFKEFQIFITKLYEQNYKMLPGISETKKSEIDNYVYKEKFSIEEKFSTSIGICYENITVYGYIIEYKVSRFWLKYWTKKFYSSKESAMDALNQLNRQNKLNTEFRIVPLFTLNKNQWRDYTIFQIIKK